MNKSDLILVTGGSGFLGRCVLSELSRRGYTNICPLYGKSHVDLTNREEVKFLLNYERPSSIIHLAARVGGILDNMNDPLYFFLDNMRMGCNLIEEAINNKVEKFVLVSTVCSYAATPPNFPFLESDLWLGGRPEPTNEMYGISKKSLQILLEKVKDKINGITLIPTNLIGPNFGDDTHVVPQVIQKMVSARDSNYSSIILYGDSTPTREFLYVEDCARGLVDAFEKYDGNEPINLGSGFEISIGDLARKIANLVGYKGEIIWDTTKPNGQMRRALNCEKAEKCFGFKAKVGLDEALEKTVSWYLESVKKLY